MKITRLSFSIVLIVINILQDTIGQEISAWPYKTSTINGEYLGQKSPGMSSQIFAPGIISFGYHEHKITISPDGTEMFYVMSDYRAQHYSIVRIYTSDNSWNRPEIASFSSLYSDIAPAFTPGGEILLFSSDKPLSVTGQANEFYSLWKTKKTGDEWSNPVPLQLYSPKQGNEINPTASSSGTLFFQADYEDKWNIYYAILSDGRYSVPVKLPYPINTEFNEGTPFIAPDESFLIFHSNRPGGQGRSDLYVSFKVEGEKWSDPQNLGDKVNSSESETSPFVSFDGKYLFFTSFRTYAKTDYTGKTYEELIKMYKDPRNGNSTIYWIDAQCFKVLRPAGDIRY